MYHKNKSTKNEIVRRSKWTNERMNTYLDIFIRGTEVGKRKGVDWSEEGWLWFHKEAKQE